jgi:hypothetical protein
MKQIRLYRLNNIINYENIPTFQFHKPAKRKVLTDGEYHAKMLKKKFFLYCFLPLRDSVNIFRKKLFSGAENRFFFDSFYFPV